MNTHTPPCLIAFASSKGGAGKSTNCLNVAGALTAMGNVVHIVDCDPSETVWRWYTANPSAQTIAGLTAEQPPKTSEEFGAYMKALVRNEKDRNFVLFDLPGQFTQELLKVATAAHLVITPAKLSEPDIIEANKLYQRLVEIGRDYGKDITRRILINEFPQSPSIHELMILDEVRQSTLPLFKAIIRRRGAYTGSFAKGITPHYATPKPDPRAIEELNALVDEIYDVINDAQQNNLQESVAA